MSGHYVYVLRCADDTLYTGYTTDVARRVEEHAAGEGAKYTRGRTPVELVHVETFASRSGAMSREHEVKSLDRLEKEAILEGSGGDLADARVDRNDGGANERRFDHGSHADHEGARTADDEGAVHVDDGGALTGPVDHPDREPDDSG